MHQDVLAGNNIGHVDCPGAGTSPPERPCCLHIPPQSNSGELRCLFTFSSAFDADAFPLRQADCASFDRFSRRSHGGVPSELPWVRSA